MQIKKMTQKDSQGNTISFEFNVPPMQEVPKYDHPGVPKGTDTVPAWLTPGEFVMNAEATRMFKPQIEAMNEQGKAVQRQQGGTIPQYRADGGKVRNDYKGALYQGAPDEGLGNLDSTIVDFIPGVGDAKAFAESQTPFDYSMAILGLIPGLGDLAAKAGKTIKHYGKNHPANAKYDYENEWQKVPEPDNLWDISPEEYRNSQVRSSHGYSWDDMMEAQSNGELLDSPEVLMEAIDELAAKGDPDAIRNIRARTRPEIIYDDGSIPFSTGGQVPQYKAEGGIMDWISSLFGGDVPKVDWPENDMGIDPNIMVDRAPATPPPQRTPEAPASLYNRALQATAAKRGWDEAQANAFDKWRNDVGYFESKNVPTRTQGDKADGIGRGLYQYEMNSGSGAAKTAANRVMSYLPQLGIKFSDIPESDRKVLSSDNPDFSQLSADTQHLAFLANHAMAPNSKLNDLVSGKTSGFDAWADWHWAGNADERQGKKDRWNKEVQYHSGGSFIDNVGATFANLLESTGGSIYDAAQTAGGYGYDALQKGAGAIYEMTPYYDQDTADLALQYHPENAVEYVMDNSELSRSEAEDLLNSRLAGPKQVPQDIPFPDPDGDMATSGINREPPPSTPVEKVSMEEVTSGDSVPMPTSFSVDSSADVPVVPKSPEQIMEDINVFNAKHGPAGFTVETAGNGRYNVINKDGNSIGTVGSLDLAEQFLQKNYADRIASGKDAAIDNTIPLATLEDQRKLAVARGDKEAVAAIDKRVEELKAEEVPVVPGATAEESNAIKTIVNRPYDDAALREVRKAKAEKTVQSIVNSTKPDAGMEHDPKLVEVIDKSTTASQEDIDRYKEENGITPEKENVVIGFFKDWGLADLFDQKEIGRMAALYLGSRALGYSHNGSLNYAVKQYAQRIDAKSAAKQKRVDELLKEGKYTAKSIDKYSKTGNLKDLVSAAAKYVPTGKTAYVVQDGKRIRVMEVKGEDEGKYYQDANGTIVDPLDVQADRPEFVRGTEEYRVRKDRAIGNLEGMFNEQEEIFGTNEDGERIIKIGPKKAASSFFDWAESVGLDPESSQAESIVGLAYQQAVADGMGDRISPTEMRDYLDAQWLRAETGTEDLFLTNEEEVKAGKAYPKYVDGDKMAIIMGNMATAAKARYPNAAPQVAKQALYNAAREKWGQLKESDSKRYETYVKAAESGETGFYKFLQDYAEGLYKLSK